VTCVWFERGVTAFARGANGGLIVSAGPQGPMLRELIIMLASRHRLPAIYPFRFYATGGGLSSYGPDQIGQFRIAARESAAASAAKRNLNSIQNHRF
jgi:putative tryptophan/tyrosine transport system substrate-binding protein